MAKMRVYPAGSYLVLTQGDYWDFDIMAHLVALRDLNLVALAEEYRKQFKPEDWRDEPLPEGFVAWLCVEGHAIKADVPRVHFGEFQNFGISV